MTTRKALHHLVDELAEEQAELARTWLEDLRDAADEDGPPLDAETVASLDRGLADIAAGRVKPLDEYERERGLRNAASAPPRPTGRRSVRSAPVPPLIESERHRRLRPPALPGNDGRPNQLGN
jgi:predicted transcriptional regulator